MGRSVTQTMELLLEQALLTEKLRGGGKAWRVAYDVMRQLDRAGSESAKYGGVSDAEPLDNPVTYSLAMIWAIEVLAAHFPNEPSPDFPTRAAQIDTMIEVGRGQVQKNLRERNQ